MTKVLVVDDEPQILRALRINLSVRGYAVVTAASGSGALRAAADEHPDVVILDLGLPDMSGIDVIGGFLTEVNVTSPTGVQEIDRLEGVRLEGDIVDWMEATCSRGRAAS